MNKLISFRYPDWKNRWEFFVDWDTKVVTVIATFISDFRPAPEFGIGTAMRSPEDAFDLRVGVPLALKRALGKIVAVNRPALTKRFFRQWKEAHPEYKIPRVGGKVCLPCQIANPEDGSTHMDHLEFATWQEWEDATHTHTKVCSPRKPFLGYCGCSCELAERIRRSKWYGERLLARS